MRSLTPPSKTSASHSSGNKQQANQPTKTIVNNRPSAVVQRKLQEMANSKGVLQVRAAKGGLPEDLKAGIEALSGYSLDDVKVHYNSSKPAEVGALAYAQGNDIYLAPGQEKHLAHEAWHIVQQKQGRVQPTIQLEGGAAINDNVGLEMEADRMGQRSSNVIQPTKSIVDNQPTAAKQHKLQGQINNQMQIKGLAIRHDSRGIIIQKMPIQGNQLNPFLDTDTADIKGLVDTLNNFKNFGLNVPEKEAILNKLSNILRTHDKSKGPLPEEDIIKKAMKPFNPFIGAQPADGRIVEKPALSNKLIEPEKKSKKKRKGIRKKRKDTSEYSWQKFFYREKKYSRSYK